MNHRSGRGPAPQLTAERTDRFAAQWRRQECSAEAHRLLGQLCVQAGLAGLAAPAERSIRWDDLDADGGRRPDWLEGPPPEEACSCP
ncbi:hypothetical protein [Streptomyces sp. NPDC056682]|uniref:hypothetical protein n=1 Tax=Streptomyces sp. NPDC056682 TaxID=3345909 RepID=UPI0036AC9268